MCTTSCAPNTKCHTVPEFWALSVCNLFHITLPEPKFGEGSYIFLKIWWPLCLVTLTDTTGCNLLHTVHTACIPTLEHHNSYNRTYNHMQWNAVWPPNDGRKDAGNMLRNNWLTIKSLIVASSWSRLYLQQVVFRLYPVSSWLPILSLCLVVLP